MADKVLKRTKWPTSLGDRDKLYAIVNEDSNVEYLVLASVEKKATLVRDIGTWQRVRGDFFENIDDPTMYNEDVDIDFIDYFDKKSALGDPVPFDMESSVLTAAVAQECPPATVDIALNLKNRLRAINVADYGPMDPKKPNNSYWQRKANMWSTSVKDAKSNLCGNCVFFVIKPEMLDCISKGIESGGSSSADAWDAIDKAELGYCEAFDFKCAASRSCDAWVTGGPVSDDVESKKVK